MQGQCGAYPYLCKLWHTDMLTDSTLTYVPKLSWINYVTQTIQIIQIQSECVIFSAGEALETCHLLNLKWLNFGMGSSLPHIPPAFLCPPMLGLIQRHSITAASVLPLMGPD